MFILWNSCLVEGYNFFYFLREQGFILNIWLVCLFIFIFLVDIRILFSREAFIMWVLRIQWASFRKVVELKINFFRLLFASRYFSFLFLILLSDLILKCFWNIHVTAMLTWNWPHWEIHFYFECLSRLIWG